MAVGEGNYGRLGPDQQQRFTTANRRLQLPDLDEQPGAMPEIAPSPGYSPTALDRPQVHRAGDGAAGVGQLRHRVAGRAPAARRAARRRPRRPRGRAAGPRRSAAIGGLRDPARRVAARRRSRPRARARPTRTRVQVGAPIAKLAIGHTLPAGSTVAKAVLDGEARDAGDAADQPRARGHGRRPARARTRWWSRREATEGATAHAGGARSARCRARGRPSRTVIAPQPRSRAVQAGPRSPIANAAVA